MNRILAVPNLPEDLDDGARGSARQGSGADDRAPDERQEPGRLRPRQRHRLSALAERQRPRRHQPGRSHQGRHRLQPLAHAAHRAPHPRRQQRAVLQQAGRHRARLHVQQVRDVRDRRSRALLHPQHADQRRQRVGQRQVGRRLLRPPDHDQRAVRRRLLDADRLARRHRRLRPVPHAGRAQPLALPPRQPRSRRSSAAPPTTSPAPTATSSSTCTTSRCSRGRRRW